MSRFDVSFEDDAISRLTMTGFDEIAVEALNECAPVLVESTKEACASVISHPGDSELVNSWTANKPKETRSKDAYVLTVVPKGNSKTHYYFAVNGKGGHYARKYAVSNALKAIWLENGINGRQDPHHFLEKAAKSCEAEVNQKIQDVFNRKVGAE